MENSTPDSIYAELVARLHRKDYGSARQHISTYQNGVIDPEGNSFYHYAVKNFNSATLRWLLENSAIIGHPYYPNIYGETCLHTACRDGRMECFLVLWKESGVSKLIWSRSMDKEGNTPLHMSAMSRTEMVKELIPAFGRDVDHLNTKGQSVLHIAAAAGILSTVRLLVNYKTLLHIKDVFGATAIHYAAVSGHLILVKYLLPFYSNSKKKIRPAFLSMTRTNMHILHAAVSSGNRKLVQFLFEQVSPMYHLEITDSRATVLHLAAAEGHSSVLQYLLTLPHLHQIINHSESKGRTAAHIAAENNWGDCLLLLINKQTDVHQEDFNGVSVYQILKMSKLADLQRIFEYVSSGRSNYYPEYRPSQSSYTTSTDTPRTKYSPTYVKNGYVKRRQRKDLRHPRIYTSFAVPDVNRLNNLRVRRFVENNMALPGINPGYEIRPILSYQRNFDDRFDIEIRQYDSYYPPTKEKSYSSERRRNRRSRSDDSNEIQDEPIIFDGESPVHRKKNTVKREANQYTEETVDYTTINDDDIISLTFNDPMRNSRKIIRTASVIEQKNISPPPNQQRRVSASLQINTHLGETTRIDRVSADNIIDILNEQPERPMQKVAVEVTPHPKPDYSSINLKTEHPRPTSPITESQLPSPSHSIRSHADSFGSYTFPDVPPPPPLSLPPASSEAELSLNPADDFEKRSLTSLEAETLSRIAIEDRKKLAEADKEAKKSLTSIEAEYLARIETKERGKQAQADEEEKRSLTSLEAEYFGRLRQEREKQAQADEEEKRSLTSLEAEYLLRIAEQERVKQADEDKKRSLTSLEAEHLTRLKRERKDEEEDKRSLTSLEAEYMAKAVNDMMAEDRHNDMTAEPSTSNQPQTENPSSIQRLFSNRSEDSLHQTLVDNLGSSRSDNSASGFYKLNYGEYRRRVVKNEGTVSGLFEYVPQNNQ